MPWHTEFGRTMQGLTWLILLEFLLYAMALQPGFLDFDNLPDTNFSCIGKVIGGYYADLETNCQMFHVCTIGQLDEPMDIRFLCLNGTVFDQETRVCERIDEVDCAKSEKFYSLNLELYGNTQPPIAEESPEVNFSIDLQKTSTTTTSTTTTTQKPFHSHTTPAYIISSTAQTSTINFKTGITSHHFPIVNTHDVHFDPEEINISLNSATSADTTKTQVPISYQQNSFEDDQKVSIVTVTTHTSDYKNDKPHRVSLLPTQNPQIFEEDENLENPKLTEDEQTPKSIVSYDLTHHHASPTEINYGFTNLQTENNKYLAGNSNNVFSYRSNTQTHTIPIHPYAYQFQSTTRRTPKFNFPATPTHTTEPPAPEYQLPYTPTKKTPRLQLPLPLVPMLPPLSFSSPAPFGFGNHIETKRYTNDHQSPPRIIISASASVSDNNGRRLNYSLGTIGAGHILASPPTSYDDYKEEDVALDPFYHDVPKLNKKRPKRELPVTGEEDSNDILKFLFDWYVKNKSRYEISIPIRAEDITQINEQLAPISNENSTESNQRIAYSTNSDPNEKINNLRDLRSRKLIVGENYPRGNLHYKPSHDSKTVKVEETVSDADLLRRIDNVLDGSEVLKSVYSILGSAKLNDLNDDHEFVGGNMRSRSLKDVDSLNFLKNASETTDPVTSEFPETTSSRQIFDGNTENQAVLTNNKTEEVYLEDTSETSTFPEMFRSKSVDMNENLNENLQTTIKSDIDVYDYYQYDEINTTDISTTTSQSNPHNESIFPYQYDTLNTTTEVSNTVSHSRPHNESTVLPHENIKTTSRVEDSTLSDYVDDNYEPLIFTTQKPITTELVNNETVPPIIITELPATTQYTDSPKDDAPSTSVQEILKVTTPSNDINLDTNYLTKAPSKVETSTEQLISSLPETTSTHFMDTTFIMSKLAIEVDSSETTTDTVLVSTTSSNRKRLLSTRTTSSKTRGDSKRWENYRPRFSSLNRRKGTREKDKLDLTTEGIILNSLNYTIEESPINPNISNKTDTAKLSDSNVDRDNSENNTNSAISLKMPIIKENRVLTDAPLSKSAIPTRTEYSNLSVSTTPLSKLLSVQLGKGVTKTEKYNFNCFDKTLHQFYSDPRDCRLFHYCTLGYNKNQLVDMKFVCDLGTYFDEDKIVCSEVKPAQCV